MPVKWGNGHRSDFCECPVCQALHLPFRTHVSQQPEENCLVVSVLRVRTRRHRTGKGCARVRTCTVSPTGTELREWKSRPPSVWWAVCAVHVVTSMSVNLRVPESNANT